jgi:hypothetical protein
MIDPVVWTQQSELTATTDGAAGDMFGESVAISGGLAIVGAPNHASFEGAAYVWVQSGSTWTPAQELSAKDGAKGDAFGSSVAVNGGIAVVGAPGHSVDGHTAAGAAYVFVQSGSTWALASELTAGDAAASDGFGTSVALSGTTAVVGAPFHAVSGHSEAGAVYVFTQNAAIWSEQAELTASDGKVADLFGFSVSVSGTIAIVGAYQHDVGANIDAGAAYIWTGSGNSWTMQQELTASDGAISDFFGYSVSVSNKSAVVGAYQHNVGAATSAGAAYVWVESGNSWTMQQELTASDAAANDFFGFSVSVGAGTAIVGAYAHQVGSNAQAGAAYAFTQSASTWTEQEELTASDGAFNDLFGAAVAANGDLAIIGALQHKVGTLSQAGAAYAFGGSVSGTANCYVGGTLYAASAANPSDACEICTPLTSTSTLSNATNGTSCGAGMNCANGACVQTPAQTPAMGTPVVAGCALLLAVAGVLAIDLLRQVAGS